MRAFKNPKQASGQAPWAGQWKSKQRYRSNMFFFSKEQVRNVKIVSEICKRQFLKRSGSHNFVKIRERVIKSVWKKTDSFLKSRTKRKSKLDCLLTLWGHSGAKVHEFCKTQKVWFVMSTFMYFLAKVGFVTIENEPSKVKQTNVRTTYTRYLQPGTICLSF